MKKALYLETIEGQEIRSSEFDTEDGIVGIKDGQIRQAGKCLVKNPTLKQIKQLFDDLIFQEFGTSSIKDLI